MQTVTEMPIVEEMESGETKPCLALAVNPTMASITPNTILITVGELTGATRVMTLSFTNGILEDELLSLLNISSLLIELNAISPGSVVLGIFQVKEIQNHLFPFRNGEIYCRPYLADDGVITHYELLSRENEEFFILWEEELGWRATDKKTGVTLVTLEEVGPGSPHLVGSEALVLLEVESNIRMLYSVYGDLPEAQWPYFMAGLLRMGFNTIEGYQFINGPSEVVEVSYTGRLNSPVNDADLYRISIGDKDRDAYAEMDFDSDCLVFMTH